MRSCFSFSLVSIPYWRDNVTLSNYISIQKQLFTQWRNIFNLPVGCMPIATRKFTTFREYLWAGLLSKSIQVGIPDYSFLNTWIRNWGICNPGIPTGSTYAEKSSGFTAEPPPQSTWRMKITYLRLKSNLLRNEHDDKIVLVVYSCCASWLTVCDVVVTRM